VNHWFARVVYERDGWDDMIEFAGASAEGWLAFMIGSARAGVAMSRGILRLLMMAGQGLSGFLLRQMEYDADRWEIHVAGSAKLKSSSERRWNRLPQLLPHLPSP
jgi:Zn-dependent protease with chaperone function